MHFSKRIHSLANEPKFLSNNPLSFMVHTRLNQLESDVYIHFETFSGEEVLVARAQYYTEYKGPYLGVIDGFFSLIQGKPLEAIDRFPIKELDYFLRDDSKEPAVSAYSQEIYEIISLGEKMKEKIFGKNEYSFQYNPENDGEFIELSASEQFEIIEELLAFEFYTKGVPLDDIECINIDDNKLTFKSKINLREKLESKIHELINKDLILIYSTY